MGKRQLEKCNLYRKSLFNLYLELDENLELNYQKIRKFYEKHDLDFDDELYLLDVRFPEDLYFSYIETLLNAKVVKYPEEIIRILIKRNCTVDIIKGAYRLIISYGYNLDFNSKMASGETYGNYFINSLCQKNDFRLYDIYNILVNWGYIPNKDSLNDTAVRFFIKNTIDSLTIFQEGLNNINYGGLSKDEIKVVQDNGILLNNKFYTGNQVIGRERELENLIISLAQEKKCPILVGESGVGKTAIVDELVYRIKTNNVPNFLRNQLIYELRVNNAIAGARYRGDFEEKIKQIIEICLERNLVIFIDEIHTIYGMGTANENPNDLASILKMYIDRDNLRLIGTTTDVEYEKYFSSDALKRRFDKIKVKEPEYDVMREITLKVINDCSMKNGITSEKILENNPEIIDIILTATCKKHRTYDDIVNNPDLTVSIIDKAFAYAKVLDSEELEIKNFIKSLEMCDRIYETAKDNAVEELKALSEPREDKNNQYIKIHKPIHN